MCHAEKAAIVLPTPNMNISYQQTYSNLRMFSCVISKLARAMKSEEIIYRDEEYYIVRKYDFSDELIRLFDSTSWGETGALYEHKDTRKRLNELERPILLEVRNDSDLVGCCVLVGRTTWAGSKSYETYFVRYLVANPKFRGQGLMTKYAVHTMDAVRANAAPGTLFIGTVEKFNAKSYNLVKAVNYRDVSTICTTSLSRLFPRSDHRVKKVSTTDEKNRIRKLLDQQYSNHVLFHQENIFHHDDYFYIEEQGEIVAGVQSFRARWVVNKLPGWSGKIIMTLLPHVPLLNKIFNPRNFEFLALEGILYQQDNMHDLHRLIEHVLDVHHLKTSLFWLDEKSKLYKDLLHFGKLGPLQTMGAASNATIMISFTDIDKDEEQEFCLRPTYQSGFDFI